MTSSIERHNNWHFLKLYVGGQVSRLDVLIVDLLPALRADFANWFFLRYVDSGGLHLRLRFVHKDPGEGPLAVTRRKCVDALNKLPLLPESDYVPMVPWPSSDGSDTGEGNQYSVGVVEAEYQPEFAKFGGQRGIAIAERVFEHSSNVALEILEAEWSDQTSRKTLGPRLMSIVTDAFEPSDPEEQFWRRYCDYWLGDTPASQDYRDRFLRQEGRIFESGFPVLADSDGKNGELFSNWESALVAASRELRHVGLGGAKFTNDFAFQFTHLMNNRLGFTFLEEAYMATLLERSITRQNSSAPPS